MTISELSFTLKLSENYIKTHWYKVVESQQKKGLHLMRRGYGSSTEYFILQLPHCNYSLEEISKLLGLSTEYFRKNFLKIQEAKAKKGIVITRIGRGKNTLYGLEYK